MTITISLPPETEEKLLKRAAESGVAADALARALLEQALNGGHAVASGQPGATLDKVLAPFRKEVEDSGMTDEEVKEFFTEMRDEVRSEKRARRTQA
jgi:hypothetical protein